MTTTLKKETRGRKKLPKSEKKKIVYIMVKGIHVNAVKEELKKIELKYNNK
jgi:hypothetical protein